MTPTELPRRVREILDAQLFGVLATLDPAGPHTTIVSFASADDIHSIVFATPSETRKLANLRARTAVSLFVDDRVGDASRILEIHGIEARGKATILNGFERDNYEGVYLAKHPGLYDFLQGAVLVRIQVQSYDVVYNFQNVIVLDPRLL